MGRTIFPDDRAHQRHYGNDREGDNEAGAEPILALALIQGHLQAADSGGQQGLGRHSRPVNICLRNFSRNGGSSSMRALNTSDSTATGTLIRNSHRQLKVVGDIAAERRPNHRRHHHRHGVNRKRLAAFFRRKGIGQNACSVGAKPPPPSPCSTRNKTSTGKFGARPHMSELTPKSTTQVM